MTETANLMTRKIIKIQADMPMHLAYKEMQKNGIRHLPVVDMVGKLVGILSDRDVQRAVNVVR
jgi:CBS domain-containing protein